MTAIKTGSLLPITPPGPRLNFHVDPDDAPRLGGAGGWSAIDRPRRVQGAVWTGLPAYTMRMDLLFGWENTASIEKDCLQLQRMARPSKPGLEPPVLMIAFRNYSALRWVITGIDWSDETWEAGERTQATATVDFLEYHSLSVVQSQQPGVGLGAPGPGSLPSSGSASNPPVTFPAGRPRPYTVRGGDTWQIISQRMLGTPARAREIATLNGFPPSTPLSSAVLAGLVGKSINIPAA